jgi:hypothetical protein
MGIEYIAWQRELIASLKEDGHWELARQAQAVLDQMIETFNRDLRRQASKAASAADFAA